MRDVRTRCFWIHRNVSFRLPSMDVHALSTLDSRFSKDRMYFSPGILFRKGRFFGFVSVEAVQRRSAAFSAHSCVLMVHRNRLVEHSLENRALFFYRKNRTSTDLLWAFFLYRASCNVDFGRWYRRVALLMDSPLLSHWSSGTIETCIITLLYPLRAHSW